MKKQILFWVLLLGLAPSVYCDNSNSSKVVFYRENNLVGFAIDYKLFAKDSVITRLKNNSFFTYNCLPGEYNFQADQQSNNNLHLSVKPGRTYYLRFELLMGFWSYTPLLTLVDSAYAYSRIHNGRMRELDPTIPYVYIRPKNRIGITLGGGGGFKNNDAIEMDNGKSSTFSFGGGGALGIKYGHEFNKFVDLAFDLSYQSSMLTPTLSNAKMNFGRGILSVTPAYIVPLGDGEKMRFKFGAGLDYYFGSSFTYDLSKLNGGYKDTWNYKNTLGSHISASFELNASDRWSWNYGLKYYQVNYKFDNGLKTYPIDKEQSNPNGSGFDVVVGFYYHF